ARELKGFRQPVRAWRVLRRSGVESRFDAARSRRLTPLIGRERELEELERLWQAGAQGHGNVAVLIGEAGIGKSRLTEALNQRIAGERHIRLRIQCSPYHTNSALYPFIHQLEKEADFRRGDTPAEKLDKLELLL